MLIANIPAATLVLVNKEIETSVQALFFDITLAAANTADETMANIKAILTATLGAATITLTRQTPDTSETIYQAVPLIDLFEMTANNEGEIRIDNDDTTLRVRCTLQISNSGAFKGSDNSKLIVAIAGKVSAAVYNIYALDLPTVAGSTLSYRTQYVNAQTQKDVDCSGTSVVAWPIDETVAVKMFFNNSQSINLTVEELKQRLYDAGGTAVGCNGRKYGGYVNLAVLNVEACHRIELTLATAQKIYLLQNTAI